MSHHHESAPKKLKLPRSEVDLAALNVAAVNGTAVSMLTFLFVGSSRRQTAPSWLQFLFLGLAACALSWLVSEYQYSCTRSNYPEGWSHANWTYYGTSVLASWFVYFWLLPQVSTSDAESAQQAE